MTNEIELELENQTITATVDPDFLIEALEDTGDYKVFTDDPEGHSDARDWLMENVIYTDEDCAIEGIMETEGVDFILDRIRSTDIATHAVRNTPTLVIDKIIEARGYDGIFGPIESTEIINHLEKSIDAMVIRKDECPTDELCEVFLSYMDEFKYMERFIRLMRQHGVMFETVMNESISDMVRENRDRNQ